MDVIMEEVHGVLKQMDEDGDGCLNREEFERLAENDFGDEMKEQAMADEDEADPDDLHRQGSKAAKAAEKEAAKAAKAAEKAEKKAEKEAAKAAKAAEKAAEKSGKFLAVRR